MIIHLTTYLQVKCVYLLSCHNLLRGKIFYGRQRQSQ